MASESERQEYVKALRDTIQRFLAVRPEHISRTDQLGALGFEQALGTFEEVQTIASRLAETPLTELPSAMTLNALTAFGNLETPLRAMGSFKIDEPGRSNLQQDRQAHLSEFEAKARAFFEQIGPVVAFALALRADVAAQEPGKRLPERELAVENFYEAIKERSNEVSELARLARENVQQLGLARYAAHFKSEADSHKKVSWIWLGVTAAAAAVVGWLAWENYDRSTLATADVGAASGIQLGIAKLILFSFAFSAVVWCGRIYRSHRHNYVVNRHRQNALSSFEAFASSTDDPQTKHAVLLQATSSIFAPQHTGFVAAESEASTQPQLVELIRTVTSPQKTS